jgi:predicted transcriptional regulator
MSSILEVNSDPCLVDEESASEGIKSIFRLLMGEGIPQSELWKALGRTSRDGSRICRRLEKKGLAVRSEIDFDGRITLLVKGRPMLTLEQLVEVVGGKPPRPHLDFKAPELTPQIQRAVAERLQDKSLKQIAQTMGVSIGTVEGYLRYARNPDSFFRERSRVRQKLWEIDLTALKFVKEIVAVEGYICSNNLLGLDRGKFNRVAEHLSQDRVMGLIEFPQQRKFFGGLAGQRLLYQDKARTAEFIWSLLESNVVQDWGHVKKRGGESYESLSSFKRTMTFHLKEVVPSDVDLLGLLRVRLNDFGTSPQ